MKTYEEIFNSVKENIRKDSFVFPEYAKLDYTGVGFGYNLKEKYPKTWKQARKDVKTPLLDKLLRGVK